MDARRATRRVRFAQRVPSLRAPGLFRAWCRCVRDDARGPAVLDLGRPPMRRSTIRTCLCRRHADCMVVPRGWTLDDRREEFPRLFKPRPVDRVGVRRSRCTTPRGRRKSRDRHRRADSGPRSSTSSSIIDGTGEIPRPTARAIAAASLAPRPWPGTDRVSGRADRVDRTRSTVEPDAEPVDPSRSPARRTSGRGCTTEPCRARTAVEPSRSSRTGRRQSAVEARLRRRRRPQRTARGLEPAAGARLPRHRPPASLSRRCGPPSRSSSRHRRRSCSPTSPRSTPIRRGCAWCTLPAPSRSTATDAGVGRRAARRVGPFARSKRLRMARDRARSPIGWRRSNGAEIDGRQHAMWALRAELEPVDDGTLRHDAPRLRRRAVERRGARPGARRRGRARPACVRLADWSSAASARRPGAEATVGSALERQRHVEARRSAPRPVSASSIGPCATARPSRSSSACVVPAGSRRRGGSPSRTAGCRDRRRARRARRRAAHGHRGRARRTVRRAGSPPGRSSACGRAARAAARRSTACRSSARRDGRHPSGRGRTRARSASSSVYRCHHGSSAAYLAVCTTSIAVERRAELGCQRGRRSSRHGGAARGRRCGRAVSPSTRTLPDDGCSYIAAIRSSVVLPLPLAPSTTHRSSALDVERDVVEDPPPGAFEHDLVEGQHG